LRPAGSAEIKLCELPQLQSPTSFVVRLSILTPRYPPHGGGHSGKCPQLIEINRVMRLLQAKKGATCMTIGRGGVPKITGDGTGKAVVTGDVVDNDNNRIGDLYNIVNKAVEAWESLLADFGLIVATNDT
jgi:hypothetical protein